MYTIEKHGVNRAFLLYTFILTSVWKYDRGNKFLFC